MKLRVFFPPNLGAAILRDAVPVKLEAELSGEVEPSLMPALALLQRWSGAEKPPTLLQLTRVQLRELVKELVGLPVFHRITEPGCPLAWNGLHLEWVGDLLGAGERASAERAAAEAAEAKSAKPASPRGKSAAAAAPGAEVDGSEHFLAVMPPPREHPSYALLLDLLKGSGFGLEPSNRKWWLRDRHKVLNFLAEHGERLRTEHGARFTENFTRNTAKLARAELACSAEEARGGYSLTLALRAGAAGEARVREALSGNRGYIEDGGKVYLLDKARLAALEAAQRALSGDAAAGLVPVRTLRVDAARVAEAQEILEALSPNFLPPASWRARNEALRTLTSLARAPVPAGLNDQLRPYQRLGLAWLWYLQRQELGGILADEMGLGKTLQAIGLLTALQEQAGGRPCPRLVVAPASLLENWRRETARFAPCLRVFVHHGSDRLEGEAAPGLHDVVVTSYGTLTRDRALFEATQWECVIADEAQHIKNRRSLNAQALRALPAKARFLLTGTPLENSLEDLRSLFEFLLPGFLPALPAGLRQEDRSWHDERLLARTAPYILRRTKLAVAPELPAKIEQVLWCEMPVRQEALYRELQQKGERDLIDLEASGASEARVRFAMLTQLLRLRQTCCDPRLLREDWTEASAKRELLRELLEEAVDDGHRVLVFSQFASLLRLLKPELEEQGIACCHLDGSMTARVRQAEIDRFQGDPSVPVFLLSLKAGGTGLNLTGADTVVHFDPWWNPAVEAQATDRAHRIGQTRTVTSYKLICSGTVEEKVLALQEEKRALLADVFEASDASAEKLGLADLKGLLSRA